MDGHRAGQTSSGRTVETRENRVFLRANSNLYESVKRGKLQFQYFDLLERVDVLLERMKQYQPSVWVAPPSMLRILADAYLEGRLTHVPQKIISVAEVLDSLDRKVLEQVFGQTVHQVYQCTEGFWEPRASTERYI